MELAQLQRVVYVGQAGSQGQAEVGDMVRTLSHYRLLESIGAGAMGTVYRAEDARSGATVAIKVLRSDLAENPRYVRRFVREATLARRLKSPHVVEIYDVGQDGEARFIVMEYVDGKNLGDILRERGPLPVQDALGIATQVTRALEDAHRHGVVHRDIKPQNIFVRRDGTVKVGDFGIARDILDPSTSTTMFLGTPYYASPEQWRDGVDVRSDIYSLGIVLFQMLVGKVPFDATTPLAIMRLQEEKEPPPLRKLRPDVPKRVHDLVHKCLQKRPDRRFQSPRELAAALAAKESGPVAADQRQTLIAGSAGGGNGGGAGVWAPPATRPEPQPRPGVPPPGGGQGGRWIAIASAGFAGLAGVAIVIGLALAGGEDDGGSSMEDWVNNTSGPTTAAPTVTPSATVAPTASPTPIPSPTPPPTSTSTPAPPPPPVRLEEMVLRQEDVPGGLNEIVSMSTDMDFDFLSEGAAGEGTAYMSMFADSLAEDMIMSTAIYVEDSDEVRQALNEVEKMSIEEIEDAFSMMGDSLDAELVGTWEIDVSGLGDGGFGFGMTLDMAELGMVDTEFAVWGDGPVMAIVVTMATGGGSAMDVVPLAETMADRIAAALG